MDKNTDRDADLMKIRDKLNISSLSTASLDDFKKIQDGLISQKLSNDELKLLVDAMPNFVQLQGKYVEGLVSLINSAKETQKEALIGISDNIKNVTDLLKIIATKSETDDLREKIVEVTIKLSDYSLEISRILQETNRDNNDTWKFIATGLSVVVGVVGVFIGKRK